MRTTRLLPIFLLLTATLLAVPAPGGAQATNDDVTIIVEAPEKLLTSHEAFSWSLTLTWTEVEALSAEEPATGLDLLAHIVAEQESTYTTTWYDFDGDGTAESAFVDEINGVSTDFTLILAGYYWGLYENGDSASTGINQIVLEPGHEIRLTYTGWPVDA